MLLRRVHYPQKSNAMGMQSISHLIRLPATLQLISSRKNIGDASQGSKVALISFKPCLPVLCIIGVFWPQASSPLSHCERLSPNSTDLSLTILASKAAFCDMDAYKCLSNWE
jgi:hypothetical protein